MTKTQSAASFKHEVFDNKKNIQDMEHSVLFSIQQTETQHNTFKKFQ